MLRLFRKRAISGFRYGGLEESRFGWRSNRRVALDSVWV